MHPSRLTLLALVVAGLTACTAPGPGGEAAGQASAPPSASAPGAAAPESTAPGASAPEASAPGASAPGAAASPDAALIAAAGAGDVPQVRRLVAEGADVTARDRQGRTALVAAAYGNHLDAVRLLLDAGADVDAADDSRQNLYLIATSEVGDDPRLLDLALAAGADPHARDSFDGTGLIRAADRGHVRIIPRLLRAGVDVDHVNRLGWTALMEAVVLGDGGPRYVETARLLLRGGADPRLPDRDGVTPLVHAERRGHTALSALLREAEQGA